MKKYYWTCFFLAMFNFVIRAAEAPAKDLEYYKKAFSLESLITYVIKEDATVLRAICPDQKYGNKNMYKNMDLDKYLSSKKIIILFDDIYSKIYEKKQREVLSKLESERIKTYKLLHDMNVKKILEPYLRKKIRSGLGSVDDPQSTIRALMESYVEYFFSPLGANMMQDGITTFDRNLDFKLERHGDKEWLKKISQQTWRVYGFWFGSYYEHIESLNRRIVEENNRKQLKKETKKKLEENEFLFSIGKFTSVLVIGEDDASKALRNSLGLNLNNIIKTSFRLSDWESKKGISNIILHNDFADYLLKNRRSYIRACKSKILDSSKKVAGECLKPKKLKKIIDNYISSNANLKN